MEVLLKATLASSVGNITCVQFQKNSNSFHLKKKQVIDYDLECLAACFQSYLVVVLNVNKMRFCQNFQSKEGNIFLF